MGGDASDMDSVDTGRSSSGKKVKYGGDGNLSSTLAFGMSQIEGTKAREFLFHNGTVEDRESVLAHFRSIANDRGGVASSCGSSAASGGSGAAGGGGGTSRGIAYPRETEQSSRDRRDCHYCCETKLVRDYLYECCMCGCKLCQDHVQYRDSPAAATTDSSSSSSSRSSSSSSSRVVRDYCEFCVEEVEGA